jgi:hypothetical protein
MARSVSVFLGKYPRQEFVVVGWSDPEIAASSQAFAFGLLHRLRQVPLRRRVGLPARFSPMCGAVLIHSRAL